MARLFLTENKFQKLSKSRNPEVRIVLSEITSEDERIMPERDMWNNNSYVTKLSGYTASVVLDGKVAFSVNAAILNRLVRNLEGQVNVAFEQIPNN